MQFAFDLRSARRRDADDRLHVESCRISKANVYSYSGSEVNAPGMDQGKIYRLYRDRHALAASCKSFENVPLLSDHAPTSANEPQKSLTVGAVSNVRYLHPYLIADICVWDLAAIQLIESGERRQLSCGYRHSTVMTAGTVDGMRFDARMTNIVGNHVALVDAGRAGPDVLVADRASTIAAIIPHIDRLRR